MGTRLIAFAVGIALLAPAAAAQTPPTDYVVGPEDVLMITVFNEPTLSGRFTVEADGTINYPLVGRVPVGGPGGSHRPPRGQLLAQSPGDDPRGPVQEPEHLRAG